MKLRALNLDDMYEILRWREDIPETLRTPYPLTADMQDKYYDDVICNRDSKTRYFAIIEKVKKITEKPDSTHSDFKMEEVDELIGMGGIENIEWENRRGEISLIINPDYRKRGYGKKAVDLILDFAFNRLNIDHVWGECYLCGNHLFWENIVDRLEGEGQYLRARKYFEGNYFSSYYFDIEKSEYLCNRSKL